MGACNEFLGCVTQLQLTSYNISTREGLNSGTLPMKDREGQPFFPVFIYDEKMMDGSLTKGLFRGPLLLRASLILSLHT